MAKRARKTEPADTIVRGTGNVFADLGFADAGERQTKLKLAYAINAIIAIFTSRRSIFFPRYSGVRPTIRPAMKIVMMMNIIIP